MNTITNEQAENFLRQQNFAVNPENLAVAKEVLTREAKIRAEVHAESPDLFPAGFATKQDPRTKSADRWARIRECAIYLNADIRTAEGFEKAEAKARDEFPEVFGLPQKLKVKPSGSPAGGPSTVSFSVDATKSRLLPAREIRVNVVQRKGLL